MVKLDEEKIFYLLLALIENILPYDFYLFNIGSNIDSKVMLELLESYHSDLMEYIKEKDNNSISSFLLIRLGLIMKDLFLVYLNENIATFLFNCLFGFTKLENKNETFFYIYKIILSLFKVLKKDLMKCKTEVELLDKIEKLQEMKEESIKSIIDFTLFEDNKNNFNLDDFNLRRKREMEKYLKKKPFRFDLRIYKEKDQSEQDIIPCNPNYPICVKECDKPFYIQIDEIYEKRPDKFAKNEINGENDENILEKIIIERRKHLC